MSNDAKTPVATPDDHSRYYEALVEASPTAIVACDPELVVTSWNPSAERLFGYTAVEARGRAIDELIASHESIRDEALAVNDRVFDGPVELITRRSRKDGSLVDVAIKAVPIRIDGQLVGAFALFEDIGELVRQRRFFESLVEMSPAAIIMVNRDIEVTLWNPGAERLFGYSATEAMDVNLDELIARDPTMHAEATAWSEEAWEGESFRRIGRRTRKDGTLVDVEIVAVRVLLVDQPIGFYIIYHDITELEQTRRQLEARIDEQMAELVRTGELARFLPRQVAVGLIGGELRAEDESFERRRITVLFADMVGFTDVAESLEPEELAEVLNGYLREMTAAVIACGGSVDNLIGDGVMAVFGAPKEMPEAEQAWAAIQAAMEMQRRCHSLGTSLRERGIPADLNIRVGINTAHCTVGVFGSEVMRAYMAVGFAVNVAARLQTAADPGSILCGFRTYALVKERVKAEERGALKVKGAKRPVEAWEIVGLADG
ncbi:MAG TPA: PAS domain S-box protein [Actinomycetota bacterium]|nr:PAS domain S-box protein [Actinomycetota bacterium]